MGNSLLPDPKSLHLDNIIATGETITIVVSAVSPCAICPCCGQHSRRIHSRYIRTVADLPWQGIAVQFRLRVRKLFCQNAQCARRIFTETLPLVVRRYGRKTCRLAAALRELAYLVGGEAAARIARSFGLAVSPDSLLRQLKRGPQTSAPPVRVLGVDDFAFRKGRRYGTILVDLEQRCPVDLLPDREAQTLEQWLKGHPGVEVISRDRGASYIEGATKGAPDALQVVDRWHLLKNVGDALERLLLKHHASIRLLAKQIAAQSLEAAEQNGAFAELVDPSPQTPTPAQQQDKQARRERRLARFEEVQRLQRQGLSLREIARRTGFGRNTVRRFARSEEFPEIGIRRWKCTKLTPFADFLRQRWRDGCHNAVPLYREIVAQGFTGSLDLVQHFVAPWRERPRSRINNRHPAPVVPTTGHLSWMLMNPEHSKVTPEEHAWMKRLVEQNPIFASAQALAQSFCCLVRDRCAGALGDWLVQVASSEVVEMKAFARSLEQDRAAVEAALSMEWSNGQVEGQVNRLKFLKRQMYGRAGFDLLKARVLPLQKAA